MVKRDEFLPERVGGRVPSAELQCRRRRAVPSYFFGRDATLSLVCS